jgi:cyclopropane fatty-acyl-phospholipid synthase-like methyltransferase
MAHLTYNPDVFKVPDAEAAKRIILTSEGGQSTEERWARETPYLAQLLCEKLQLAPGQLVVDFGCGLGRMARALIERSGCSVLGIDISEEMRGLAPAYVRSPAFSVVSNEVFAALVAGGLRIDAAISVWVLQHCLAPADDVALLAQALKTGGRFGLVNAVHRAVPTREKRWARDGLDVRALMDELFVRQDQGTLDPAHVGDLISAHAFWGVYAKA